MLIRILFALTFLTSTFAFAQPEKGEFIKASIGLGLSSPTDDADINGKGFYAQAEYIWAPRTWFSLRPYFGFILASEEELVEKPEPYESRIKTNAVMLGGKFRLIAPIPYFAPYFELGVGASIGSFETDTYSITKKKSGIVEHIPFSLGAALGKENNYDIAFTYYFHDKAKQYSGAFAVGVIFPLD